MIDIGNDAVEIKATIKHVFAGGQKANGWFGCYAHIRGEAENIKLFGMTILPITKDIQIKAKIKKSTYYEGGYDATDIQIITRTTKGIINYLKNIDGISRYTAEKIVMVYGDDTIDMIKAYPNTVQQECNLSDKQMEAILKIVNSEDIRNQILTKFPEIKDKIVVDRIIKTLPNPMKTMKDDPYQLQNIPGVSFKIADTIAQKTGTEPTSQYRINHGIVYTLETEMGNNLFINLTSPEQLQKFCCKVEDLLNIQFAGGIDEFSYRLLALAQIKDSPVTLELYNNEYHLYLTETYQHMMWLIEWMNNMNEQDKNILAHSDNFDAFVKRQISFYETSRADGIVMRLTDEQKDAVKNVLMNRLSIITGGPGRGKTTIIDCIASCWADRYVLLLAPTGRATHKLKKDTNYRYDTMTIDRYICECKAKRYATSSKTLIIIDESSMLDIEKAYNLFRYAHDAHVCLVGDVDQLPPIQPGYVLKDAIASNQIPTSYLTKSLRCKDEILENAEKIRTKNTDLKWDLKIMSFFTYEEENQESLDKIIDQYKKVKQKYPDDGQAISCKTRFKFVIPVIPGCTGANNTACPLSGYFCFTFLCCSIILSSAS